MPPGRRRFLVGHAPAQNGNKRTTDVLPKPDKLVSYRQIRRACSREPVGAHFAPFPRDRVSRLSARVRPPNRDRRSCDFNAAADNVFGQFGWSSPERAKIIGWQ